MAPHLDLTEEQAPGRSSSMGGRLARLARPNLMPGAVGFVLIPLLLILVLYPLIWIFLRGLLVEQGTVDTAAFWQTYSSDMVRQGLRNSLIVSFSVSLLAGVFGIFLAWAVSRTDIPMRGTIQRLAIVPFITTPLIGAFAWVILAAPNTGILNVLFFHRLGISIDIYSMPGIIFVMALYLSPQVFLLVSSVLRNIDPSLEEASVICGRSRIWTFVRVTLPLAAPAILASLILTFVLAMEQFGVPAILGTPRRIYLLTTVIYQYMHSFPARYIETSAVAALLLLLTAIFVYAQRKILGSRRSFVTIGGREFRPQRVALGRARLPVFLLCCCYLLLAVALPFGGLLVVSLFRLWTAEFDSSLLTLSNYTSLLSDATVRRAIWNSTRLGVLGALSVSLITTIAAYLIMRANMRGKGAISFLTTIPVAVPGIVLAVGIFQAYIHPPLVLYGTFWILYVAYLTRHLPYGMRASESSLHQLHPDLELAAQVSGASWLRTFVTIVVPLIAPGIIAGVTIMFISMMRELSASVLLYTNQNIVNAVLMVDMWEGGEIERLAAYAMIISGLTFGLLTLVQRITKVDLTRRA